jgi:hypothetical protein
MSSLSNARAIAVQMGLDSPELSKHKKFQTKICKILIKWHTFDFQWFFNFKVSKFLPFDACFIIGIIIKNLKIGNNFLPGFMCIDYLKMVVDEWCVQTRFGHKDSLVQ